MAPIVASPESDVFVALLNLEQGSRIYLDGVSVIPRTPDFLGFKDLPFDAFHLVCVRGATTKNDAAITVGFVVFDAPLIRRFDPQSEEVSGKVPDEVTVQNLSLEMKETKISSPQILLFSSVVSPSQASTWKDQTSYISRELLEKRELAGGHKIVPGCYDDDDRTGESYQGIIDGKSVCFPSIPVVDSTKDVFRSCKHLGTKRYLKQLLPSVRTELFNDVYPSKRILEDVLLRCCQGNWRFLLGDIQLAFALVLNLHCFSSLECWRDLVAMLCVVEPEGISSQCDLYLGFLQVMSLQVTSMDRDLLQDLEVSEGTFLFTYFKSLSGSISRSSANTVLGDALSSFRRVLMNRFPTFFSDQFFDPDCNLEMVEGVLFEDEDDDGPIVVAEEEFSAAMARSSPLEALATPKDIQEIYPLLVAAIQTHEDILMTCARALDEASDVSLVREAASYLQTIEQYR